MNDVVTIAEGPVSLKGKAGTVEYVWRGMFFIRGRQLGDSVNGGYVCVRGRSCNVRGGVMSAADIARMAAGTPRGTPMSPAHGAGGARYGYAPQSPMASLRGPGGEVKPAVPTFGGGYGGGAGGGGPGGAGAPPGGGGFGQRNQAGALIGKVIKVVGGAYNGYRGRVKQESDTHVQVEGWSIIDAFFKNV